MFRYALVSWWLLALAATALLASPPVPFSGKLAVDGKNFHGNALFAFSIVDQEGAVHWRHAEAEDSTIENFVLNGRYLVLLGGHGMKQLPAGLFLEEKALYLRVSVDLKDGQGMRLLTPDQQITSSPYALAAEVAQLAQRATIANGVEPGSVTADMLNQALLQDLNRSVEMGEITRDMLPQDVRNDLNRTIGIDQLSAEVTSKLNRELSIEPGSIGKSLLSQDVRNDLNATITRERLSADVRADLNRTITHTNLSSQLRADLNRTITKNMLGQDVLSDLNRTVTYQDLSPQVKADLNRTITKSMLSQEVLIELNSSSGGGGVVPGSLLAVPKNQPAPSGYSLFQAEAGGERKDLVWEERAPVSVVRNAYDGVEVLGGKIYFVGGKDGSSAKNIAERYDPANNTWETLANMSAARQGVACAVLNEKLYAIGGNGLSSVEVFDPSNGSWSAGIALPSEVNHGTAITADGKIYLIGGRNSSNQDINQVLCFDPSTSQWSTKANMPTARHGAKPVWFENRIWAIGGREPNMSKVESFDPSTDTWQTEASLTTARGWPVAWVANGRIYVGGGYDGSTRLNSIEVYDPTTKQWASAGNFPQNEYVADAVVLNDKVYVVAGQTATNVYSNKVFAADLNASVSGVFDLYRKDGNASSGVPTVQAEVADGSVTASKMASNTITTNQLSEQILKYLQPEVTIAPQAPGLVFNGQTVTLLSRAEGKYLTYQWYKNGQPIAGATADRYVIDDVNKTQHDGNYSLVVSNDFGTVTTPTTTIDVNSTPTTHSVLAANNLEMIFCPPGTFTMGSPTTETGRGGDETQHQVTLTHGFYLGKYEVTQAQYETVMTGNSEGLNAKPSAWLNNNDRPVERVSWNDAQVFLSRLNDMEETAGRLPTGWKYVLPTEAQWEYACRAGTTSAYSWGNDINSSLANYNWDGDHNTGNDSKQTVDVGQFSPNPWGFFDMQGNVWEWVYDWQASYPVGSLTNPEGPATGSTRVHRGGSFAHNVGLRSADRGSRWPSSPANFCGFRLAFQPMPADTANPELELFGGATITHSQGIPFVEPGVEAHDVRDGNITDQVVVTGSIDVNSTGTYLLTYTVQDGAGNSASTTRTVTVVGNRSVDLNATVAMDMIWVQPGTFTMGSPITEAGRGTDETEHNVTLTQGFYLGKYEVTQAQYEAVMTGVTGDLNATPSNFHGYPDRPVEMVSWNDAQVFLTRLNEQQAGNLPAGWRYVLPTESQWEYACRAGTSTAYSWGNTISSGDANWNHGSDLNRTVDVGGFSANPWGFFDMHGNVWELTADAYSTYPTGNPVVDPTSLGNSDSNRARRGGSWVAVGTSLRSAKRLNINPSTSYSGTGFRVGFQKQ